MLAAYTTELKAIIQLIRYIIIYALGFSPPMIDLSVDTTDVLLLQKLPIN